mmetsp:Transcript_49897/g.120888  ORF Transcript_49897/g.120888 Transcript_49897/m.120888 type:complete len:281 (-) Transcript_49897:149-991(-)
MPSSSSSATTRFCTLISTMALLSSTFSRSSSSFVRAFTSVVVPSTSSSRSVAAAAAASSSRMFMSSSSDAGPMPYGDDKMPFYALGTNLAMQVGGQGNFKNLLEEDELDIVLEGFCDNLKGTNTQDARAVLTAYGQQLNKILQERTNLIVDRVKKDGEDFVSNFLDCNDEAVKTDSGLVYYEMTAGEGAQPELSSTVEVHYHGTLTDGTVFDSSVDRGQTISFPLSGVIKGWQEGLAMMKEGGKATLVIPSDLAYGDNGSGDAIPPGATLKFEVELFKVS